MPPVASPEQFADLQFPLAGIDLSQALERQPFKQMKDGRYASTTPEGVNVRAFDPATNRMRGGRRFGLAKYYPQAVVAGWIVQSLDVLAHTGGTVVQLNQAGRIVSLVAVSQGYVFSAQPGDTTWTLATNNTGDTPPLNFTGVLYSTALNQKLWFADGVNWVYFDPSDNTVRRWAPTAGALPVDSANNTPRLICTWRGRIVLSGLIFDPQNWFMSASFAPTDFDYSPPSITPTQAVAGNNSSAGQIGDVVTALVPYSDDVLIFGGDHTIYLMRGDPMQGGQIDLVSDAIGFAWGNAWCKDPYGTVYFVSNRTGIYSLVPGQQPVRISQQIEQLLQEINTGTYGIRLVWDDRFQGLHVFVTKLTEPAPATHFFYELRTGAWWTDTFGNDDHNPLTCCTYDGNLPTDRIALIGSWDGYVRCFSASATNDDGKAIASAVVLGPILTSNLDEMLLKDLQAVLANASGDVTFAVHVGATAELALASAPVLTGTWSADRNLTSLVRRSGHAIFVRITSSSPWAMETIRARIAGSGKVRRRGH